MRTVLETLAFALLIGGQFLAVTMSAKRMSLYPETTRTIREKSDKASPILDIAKIA